MSEEKLNDKEKTNIALSNNSPLFFSYSNSNSNFNSNSNLSINLTINDSPPLFPLNINNYNSSQINGC